MGRPRHCEEWLKRNIGLLRQAPLTEEGVGYPRRLPAPDLQTVHGLMRPIALTPFI